MKFSSGTAGIIALGLVAAPMACIVTGCSQSNAVAATVNGQEIKEQTITDYIQNYRATNNLENDSDWAQYLVDNGLTPETLREQTINYYVQTEVIAQDAEAKGVSVSDDEVEEQLVKIKDYYDYDDAKLEEQVTSIGYTMDTYKEYVKQTLLQEKLSKEVASGDEATDEQILESASSYATILNGAKYIDCIVLDLADKDKAAEVAEKAKSGDFEALSSEYSTTEEFDGWNVLVMFDDAVSTAATNMEVGDVSDVIEGAEHLYIIKITDKCEVGEDGFKSVDEIPEAIREQISESIVSANTSSNFSTYVDNLVETADVVINPMPENLPYNVSLEGVTASSDNGADLGTNGGVSVDGDTTITIDENGQVVSGEDTSVEIESGEAETTE